MEPSQESKFASNPRFMAVLAVLAALYVVTEMIHIDLPQPLDYVSLAPVVIMTFGLLLKPVRAFLICGIGAVIAQLIISLYKGEAILLVAYLPGAFFARGIEALIISIMAKYLIYKKDRTWAVAKTLETIILVIGTLWEVLAYALIGVPYFVYVWGYPPAVALGWYLAVAIDLIFVPVGIAVVAGVRHGFHIQTLDGLLFKDNP